MTTRRRDWPLKNRPFEQCRAVRFGLKKQVGQQSEQKMPSKSQNRKPLQGKKAWRQDNAKTTVHHRMLETIVQWFLPLLRSRVWR